MSWVVLNLECLTMLVVPDFAMIRDFDDATEFPDDARHRVCVVTEAYNGDQMLVGPEQKVRAQYVILRALQVDYRALELILRVLPRDTLDEAMTELLSTERVVSDYGHAFRLSETEQSALPKLTATWDDIERIPLEDA